MRAVHLACLVFLLAISTACSDDRATSTKKESKVQESLIKIGPDGSVETPQVKIDGRGNAQVPGLGGMKFAPNGDIYGSDGAKLYDGKTGQWLTKMKTAQAPSSAPSGGQRTPTMSAADVVAKLNTLTRGFNYRGHEYGKETVKRSALNRH